MYSKRGGRVQVNMMQYQELVERVEKLETQNDKKEDVWPKSIINKVDITKEEVETVVLTKNEAMALLDEKEIKYNPRDKKDVLIELLNTEE